MTPGFIVAVAVAMALTVGAFTAQDGWHEIFASVAFLVLVFTLIVAVAA